MDDMATSLLTKFTSQSNIFIKNPSTTHAKLSKILTGGANNLSLTVDFDRTLTSAASLSSHGILEAIEGLADKQYQAAAHETTAKYYPIEIDPVMTVAEKIPHMKKVRRGERDERKRTTMSNPGVRKQVHPVITSWREQAECDRTTSNPGVRKQAQAAAIYSHRRFLCSRVCGGQRAR